MKSFVFGIVLTALTTASAVAQYYHTPYGHNRIQYKNFEWYFYSTNNFEVYYYPGGQDYALHALNFLEEEFTELTDVLGYAPYTKTKIFVYNSLQDLQQSNIGISGDVYTIGGKTDFVKLQVEIAYTGQTSEFKKEMLYKLSKVLINDMMFGGSLAEIFQNSYLLSLPEWFINGAARYLAYGWDQEMDDYVRDYLSRKQINKLVKIQNDNASIVGQSIWNYIAIKYGQSNISNILNLTRIIRNEENSISNTLGISFKRFLSDWQNFYLIQQEEILDNYQETPEQKILASYGRKNVEINHVKINSTGEKVAYTFHKNGKYKVNVVDLNSGREETIARGGYLINEQEIDFQLPLIDWQDNHTVGVVLYKRGHLYLNTYNVSTGKRLQKPLNRFRQIESFSFNDNGRLAIISGDIDGQNDLFLISMRRNALKRITNDLFDDIDPVFIPGTAAIVFSSNREEDSVEVGKVELKAIGDNYNLFLYDLDTTTHSFQRLTNTFSIDRKPFVKNQYYIYYLSDQKGISNLYRYNMLDKTFSQASNFEYSILDYDLSFDQSKITYLMLDGGRSKVFLDESFDLNRKIFTPQTARQRMAQAKFIAGRFLEKNKKEEATPEETFEVPESKPIESELTKVDSLVLPESFFFTDEDEKVQEEVSSEKGFIDTDNYVFEDDRSQNKFKPESFFSNYRKLERKSRVIGPQAYEPRFSFNNLITSFAIDPIRGFSILLETEVDDILENHRLIGGVLTTTDLRSGNIYGEYQYLKYWMDFHLRFNRNAYLINDFTEQDQLVQKYILNKIEIAASVPLTNVFRFEASPFYANTIFNNLQNQYVLGTNPAANFAEDSKVHYAGARVAAVLDNTIEKGFNIHQGTRALVEFENYFGVTNTKRSFSRVNVDLRHYQKIHKEITFASRLFYGHSFGASAQNYVLGGMQNWVFRQFEGQGLTDPFYFSNTRNNSNLLFTRFVTNLRGFDYNEMFGTDALLFNAELRLPIFRYFASAPISSAFLRNFQVIGFYDMGTAWTGKPPFTKEGTAFRKKYAVKGSSFTSFSAEIANFQNPWLAGYGFGVRTVLLGYYIKVDVARPIQDFEIGDTRIYLTLGLDF